MRPSRRNEGWRPISALAATGLVLAAGTAAPRAAELRFRVDDWITECGIAGCSITGLFQQTNLDGRRGAFALVIMLPSRQLAVVGQPHPIRARLRIDTNAAAACVGARYCVFPGSEAVRAIGELGAGSLILLDVHTDKAVFRSSLSTKGYRASLAKLEAEGYDVPAS